MEEQATNKLTALALVEVNAIEAGLAELRQKYSNVVFDVTTNKGMSEAKAARSAIRDPRYALEKIRKAKVSELKTAQTELNARADEIEQAIRQIEDPIDQQIKTEEERKERERIAAIKAEEERVAKIRDRINQIANLHSKCVAEDKSSYEVQQILTDLSTVTFSENDFQEFHSEAVYRRGVVCEDLEKLVAKLKTQESERAAAAAAKAQLDAKDREIAELRAQLAAMQKPVVSEPFPFEPEAQEPEVSEPAGTGVIESTFKGEPIDPATESWPVQEPKAEVPRLFAEPVPSAAAIVRVIALSFGITEKVAREYIVNAAAQIEFEGV